MPKKKIHEYRGEALDVLYDVARCIHAAECVASLPAVFDSDRRPWIEPDRAEADEVRAAVGRCPTGALSFRSHDGGGDERPAERNTVLVVADGPLYLSGDLSLELTVGSEVERRAALCRCGASENKPFCDNSHRESGFEDPGRLGESRLREPDVEGTGLRVRPAPDGPLLLSGPMTLRGADSEERSGGRTALCRCGASDNKPFCDGSHNRIAFRAE